MSGPNLLPQDTAFLRLALRLARRGYGATSPNPMVGAVLVKGGRIIGRGWHRVAGGPHAEIEALLDADKKGLSVRGATLFVTLEPCCTYGRTPPCTEAIIRAGIKRVVAGATDPNPSHRGKGFSLLKGDGVEVVHGALAHECAQLNAAFNHWIVHRTPFVTVKAAMTLDGKIATASGESKWITGEQSRAFAMTLRQGADAIVVGINTILADDPRLTVRTSPRLQVQSPKSKVRSPGLSGARSVVSIPWSVASPRRIVLDSSARTPLTARVVTDDYAHLTTIVVSESAPKARIAKLAERVRVLVAPQARSRIHRPSSIPLPWLLKQLGAEEVTSLMVEGGGEVNASFLLGGLAQRIAFFYAPKVLGGRDSIRAVAGAGAKSLSEALDLEEVHWRKLGDDLLLTARVVPL